MSTPTRTLALNEDELAILREALRVTSAIKAAQGHPEDADALNSLRERTEGLPLLQTGQVDQHSSFPRSRGSAVNNHVRGSVTGSVIQAGDITGGINL